MAAIVFWDKFDLERLEKLWDIYDASWDKLFAFLLYTEADQELDHFITANIRDIHNQSGENVLIFLLDKRDLAIFDNGIIPQFLTKVEQKLQTLTDKTDISEVVPLSLGDSSFCHTQETVYTIADRLELSYRSIPCLVFFHSIKDKEICIYEILKPHEANFKPFEEQFREVFDFVRVCGRNFNTKKEMFDCLKNRFLVRKIKKNLKSFLTWVIPFAAKAAKASL